MRIEGSENDDASRINGEALGVQRRPRFERALPTVKQKLR